MPPRAISSGTISFGLVSIPVKVYTATSSKKVSFNMLERETGARPKQQYVSSVNGKVLERDDIVKGYEHARGQYVQLTGEELKTLEADRTGAMEIVEFVPSEAVDLVQIEKSYYLGPDKGGDKAYQLLGQAMRRKGHLAVARWAARGKEQLVVIRPYQKGLILHQLFYAEEVRAFGEIDLGAELTFSEIEMELAEKLVDQLAKDDFDASSYTDTYTERVKALIDQKVAGEEITLAPTAPRAQIIDLFEALKQSLDSGPAKVAARAAAEPEARPLKKAKPRKAAASKKKASG